MSLKLEFNVPSSRVLPFADLKVALVHDYLREYGGAERVLEAIHDLFPTAPVYVAFTDPEVAGIHWKKFQDWHIHQSWIIKIPFYKKLFSPLRIFAPHYFRAFDLTDFDLVISSSNAYFGKAIKVRKNDPSGRLDAVHICYCHTPARSLYGYSTMTDWESRPITKVLGTLINHYLRIVDFQVAQKVDQFLANSQEVKRRIAKFYRRDAVVIYPPVNVPDWAEVESWRNAALGKSTVKTGYFLYVNRLAFAKHPEMAIQACTELNLPLKVVGEGKLLPRLKAIAGPTVEFLGAVLDQELDALYVGASALLYPVEDEDFGIVPVEAMGHGVPVLAHRSGGPQETIKDGETGLFFNELSTNALIEAIYRFQKMTFNSKKIHHHALQFSHAKFSEKMLDLVKKIRPITVS